jgi:DNA polymerase-3 subunit epsilon
MDYGAILNTLLHELKEAVIVCDNDANIILFNRAAEDSFDRNKPLSTGKSLYNLCLQPPVEHALSLLQYQHGLKSPPESFPYVQFMNASASQESFFRCRVSLLPPLSETKNSFVIIFENISTWYIPDNPLFMKIEEFRAPMTNLRAAVENLTEFPEMSPVMRSAFENVLVQESLNLTEAFNSFSSSCRVIMQTHNHLSEMNTEVLFGYVTDYLEKKGISVAVSADRDICVKVDIYGLLLVLDYLVSRILQTQQKTRLSCEANIGEQFMYFDFIWSGPFIPTAAVEKMLEKTLDNSVGRMTVASILHSMDGDIWSQQHETSKGTLRLALPVALKTET